MDDRSNSGQPAAENNCALGADSIAPELRAKKRKGKPNRTEYLQHLEVNFPPPTSLPAPSMPEAEPVPEAPVPVHIDYPHLRTKLSDQGLPFRAKFNQAQTAQVIGVSDRTVRDWTNEGKMPCCRYPSGRPYYTPGNIENLLIECERPRPRKAAK
jgi:hypothetical protein